MARSLRQSDLLAGVDTLVDRYVHVDQPSHTQGRILLDYWQFCMEKHGCFVVGRDIPARVIATLLAHIIVSEPVKDGTDMRIRLAGTALRRRFGEEIAGRFISELFDAEDFRHHLAAGHEVLRSGRPQIIESRLTRGAVEELHSEAVLLPARSADLAYDWIVTGVFFFT
jgi:hypothetical protein